MTAGERDLCIGVDVGGTFTDVVLSDGSSLWTAKAPSTPGRIGDGVLAAVDLVAAKAGTTVTELLPRVERFGLGTTAVTNTLASRTGLRVGLVTTSGFEHLIPMAKGRLSPDNGWMVRPPELVTRERIVGVAERVDRSGTVLQALDVAEAVRAGRHLVEHERVEAIAVSFLWSFVNPAHEEAAVAALREAFPDVTVVGGAELLPVIREYERTTFAILNAYTARAIEGLGSLIAELERLGLSRPPLLVHSGGGSISAGEAAGTPIVLAESGPAAGAVAALTLCRAMGIEHAVTCDMGGTSYDVSTISGGELTRRRRGVLMGIWTALSMVDIESASAGGGSLAWVDPLGLLRVGPRSAGAVPGPACYGRGGTVATVTDALVVLGYIDPAAFVGGQMQLDVDAARQACAAVAAQLGCDLEEAAWGIREVAQAEMTNALRSQLAERGLDPAQHSMISFGGCGGLFAWDIADRLGIGQVVAPEMSSVLSAFGAATADIRRERGHAVTEILPVEPGVLEPLVKTLVNAVDGDLEADGVPPERRSIRFELDVRFSRQKHEITMIVDDVLSAEAQERLVRDFHEEYERRYGAGALGGGAATEIAALRAIGTGRTVRATLRSWPAGPPAPAPVAKHRSVHIDRGAAAESVPVSLFAELQPGHELVGPALVDSDGTTLWVPVGTTAVVDERRSIVFRRTS